MSGTKPIASLGPLLLARKGTAKPAMRTASSHPGSLKSDNDIAAMQAELGWNDMGDIAVITAEPAVPRQREELVTRLDDVRQARAKTQKRAQEHVSRRSAFTLRLDAERHLRLKLAAAVEGESAQQLVTQALDQYLADMPELETLAAQVKRNSKKA